MGQNNSKMGKILQGILEGQEELRKGQEESRKEWKGILEGQEELRKGQEELRKEWKGSLEGQEELRKGQEELRKGADFGHGTYYASLDSIWQQNKVPFAGAAKKLRDYRAKDTDVLAIYNKADGTNMMNLKLSSKKFPPHNMFPGAGRQTNVGNTSLAHSAPNDNVCIFTWGEVVALITGKESNSNSNSMLASEDLRNFVCGNTGAKNPFRLWAWNYLQLPISHADYYDKVKPDKAVIITPIWDPKAEWTTGTPYKLLVAAKPDGYKWLMGVAPPEKNAPAERWLGEASAEEYGKATDFLQLVVTALADLLNESDLINAIQVEKQNFNDAPAAAATTNGSSPKNKQKPFPNNAVISILQSLYGENFWEKFIGTYVDESASRNSRKSSRSGSQSTRPSKNIQENHMNAFAKKLLSLLDTKERMKRLGKEDAPAVFAPGMMPMPSNPILTIDLGEYFKDRSDMIPDPYWVSTKAGASIALFYRVPLVGVCNSFKDEIGNAKKNDAPLPGEIEIDFDCDLGSVHDSISVCSESEYFTGTPGTGLSVAQVGEIPIDDHEKGQRALLE